MCPTTIWSTLVIANASTPDAMNGSATWSTARTGPRRTPIRIARGEKMMKSTAEARLPAIRPTAKPISPWPVATRAIVTATPIQLSTCSITTRVPGARRWSIARGAVTRPLIRTLSVTHRIAWAAPGVPMVAASAGAPA